MKKGELITVKNLVLSDTDFENINEENTHIFQKILFMRKRK